MQEQNSKDISQASIKLEQKPKEIVSKLAPSQFFQIYKQKVLNNKISISDTHESNYFQKWVAWQYHKIKFKNKINISIETESINRQVIQLRVEWGRYSYSIKIFNVKSKRKQLGNYLCSGNYGSVYQGLCQSQKFIIKSLSLRHTTRKKAIQEYILIKLCSQLNIGPYATNYLSFDILMFEDCCVFAMEKCEKVTQQNFKVKQLYENIRLLHDYYIVHQDIKPQNIMFSPSFNKLVFIDFGLSTIIEERWGNKTETAFVGSFSYCGQEMKKILPEKEDEIKIGMVDLYFNDLVSLENTIKSIRSTIQHVQVDIQEFFQIPLTSAPYLLQLRLKYLIYCQFSAFSIVQWNAIMEDLFKMATAENDPDTFIANNKNKLQTVLLQFMEEINPKKELRQLIQQVIPSSFSDSQIYHRIKTIYQISQKSLCGKQMLFHKEKYHHFNEICQQIQAKQYQSQSIKNIVLDKLMGTIVTPFLYIQYYLEYISYLNNKHGVNSSDRFEAAKAYYRLFHDNQYTQIYEKYEKEGMNKPDSNIVLERQIITYTILHSLYYLLELNKKEYKYYLNWMLFRVYQFIFILDLGTGEKFIKWIESIYNHWSFEETSRYFFLIIVRISNIFNDFRITSKQDMSRLKFVEMIENWIITKMTELNHQNNKIDIQNLENLPNNQFIKESLRFELFCRRLKDLSLDKYMESMVDLFYISTHKHQHQRILIYFAQFFKYSYRYHESDNICKQIINIWKDNLRDEELQKQFSFDFLLKMWKKKVGVQSTTVADINEINNYCLSIDTDNLFFLVDFLNIMSPKLQPSQQQLQRYVHNYQNSPIKFSSYFRYIYENEGYMNRLFESSLTYFKIQIEKDQEMHRCKFIEQIIFSYLVSQHFVENRFQKLSNLICVQMPNLRNKCRNCELFLTNVLRLNILKEKIRLIKFNKISQVKEYDFKILSQEIQNIMVVKKVYDQIICSYKNLSEIDLYYQFLLYDVSEQICLLSFQSQQFQNILHGVLFYYLLLINKYNKMKRYFTLLANGISLIRYFAKYYRYHLLELILRLAYHIKKTLSLDSAIKSMSQIKLLLEDIGSEKDKWELYGQLRHHNPKINNYIIMFYCEFLLNIKILKLQKNIFKVIYQMLDKIHFRFKRIISFYIYHFSMKLLKYKGKRYIVHYRNILVKRAMNDDRTEPIKKNFKKINRFTDKLQQKMKHFEVYYNLFDNKTYKFKRIIQKQRRSKQN